jgi:hypothetical protein
MHVDNVTRSAGGNLLYDACLHFAIQIIGLAMKLYRVLGGCDSRGVRWPQACWGLELASFSLTLDLVVIIVRVLKEVPATCPYTCVTPLAT